MESLILYQFEQCPFCRKVRGWLDGHGIDHETVNVEHDRNDPVRRELAERSGVATVPVLKVGVQRYIGDSDRIISWLEEHKE